MRTHLQIMGAVSIALLSAAIAAAEPPSTPSSTKPDKTGKPADERKEAPPADDQQPGTKGVDEGLFPKSIRIPGTDVSPSVGGYVKVDFIQENDVSSRAR